MRGRWIVKGPIILVFSGILMVSCRPLATLEENFESISFSGYSWLIKSSNEQIGPGPNYYSNKNVWVDDQGQLHLKIIWDEGQWTCAEIISQKTFGYGTFVFKLASPVDDLDPQAVAGFFTWHPGFSLYNREVDIELTKWGRIQGPNGLYAVQPAHFPGHQQPFVFRQHGYYTTHSINWTPKTIIFASHHGHGDQQNKGQEIARWEYKNSPKIKPRNIQVRMNLWLYRGKPPIFLKEIELVVKEFVFIPRD